MEKILILTLKKITSACLVSFCVIGRDTTRPKTAKSSKIFSDNDYTYEKEFDIEPCVCTRNEKRLRQRKQARTLDIKKTLDVFIYEPCYDNTRKVLFSSWY